MWSILRKYDRVNRPLEGIDIAMKRDRSLSIWKVGPKGNWKLFSKNLVAHADRNKIFRGPQAKEEKFSWPIIMSWAVSKRCFYVREISVLTKLNEMVFETVCV